MSPTEPAPVRKSIPQVDFDLDDLDADEERYLDFYRKVGVQVDMLVPSPNITTVRTASTDGSSVLPPGR
ncbi:hypothetical protein ACFQ7G_03815 [Streptomyces massasporeus]